MIWNIAICEDNPTQQQNLLRMLKNWQENSSHNLQIHTFSDCESFWFVWSKQMNFDILLLDIDLGEDRMTGMELARQIRKKDPKLTIIFITALFEYISEGYDVQAFHYLLKPLKENKLFEILNRVAATVNAKEDFLLLENESGVQIIAKSQILYAEAFSHTIELYHQKNQQIICQTFRMSMAQLEEKLASPAFYRCHRSYLIHLNHTQKLNKGMALLDCGNTIPVSRSKEKHLYETFLNYHRQSIII